MNRPRTCGVLRAAVAVLLLSLLPWPGTTGEASAGKHRANARAAVAYPDRGITVFSATGKVIRRWEPKVDREKPAGLRAVAYYFPHLHPGGGQLVCVKCVTRYADQDARQQLVPQSVACDLTELSVDEGRERVLLALAAGREISSPAYSPDGGTIALVQDGALVLYSVREQTIVRTIPNVVATSVEEPSVARFRSPRFSTTFPRWAGDGSAVFVYGPRPLPIEELKEPLPEGKSPPNGVATIDLGSAQVSWMNLYNPLIVTGHHTGPCSEIRNGKWLDVEGTLPARESIQALFGSERYPVRAAPFTSDGRSFLFVDPASGLFWRDWLMRYDIPENALTLLRTLEARTGQ